MQATSVWHARRWLSVGLAAALLIPLMIVAGLGSARAAALGPGVTIYPAGYGAVHLGPHEMPQGSDPGEPGFCVQARVYAPTPSDAIASTGTFSDSVLAYIYATHRHATDDATAAAIGYETHMRAELPGSMAGGNVDTVRSLIAAATPQFVKDRAAQLVAEATGLAGPWQAASAPAVDGSGTRTGVIHIQPLVGIGGAPMVGYPIAVRLNGPATLDATGTKVWTGTTQATRISLAWTAEPGANGEVTWDYRFEQLPRTTLTYVHPSGQRQAQLTYGMRLPSDPEEMTLPGLTFRAVGDFRPQGVSSAPVFVDVDEDLVDTFVPRAHPEDVWVNLPGGPVPVTYTYDVYDVGTMPVPESAAAPSGTPVVSGTAVGTEGVPIELNVGRAPMPSTYVWVWGTSKQLQPAATRDYVRDVVWTDGTKFDETTVSRWPITHYSLTREYNVVPGGRVFDTIVISGTPHDHGQFAGLGRHEADLQHADVTVYGPLESRPTTPEVPADAPVFWHDTIPATNGTFEIGWDDANPIIAPAQATYDAGDYFVFVYSFDGDHRVAPYTSPFNDLAETWYVPVDRTTDVETWLATVADADVAAGQPFGDAAFLTGTIVEDGYLVFEAFGPFVEDTEPVQSTETLLWTSEQIPVPRAGAFRSGTTTAELPEDADEAFVYWVATYYDADGEVIVAGVFGDPAEVTRVFAPLDPGLVTEAAVFAAGSGEPTTIPVAGDSTRDVLRPADGARFAPGSTAVARLYFAPVGTQLVCTPDQLVHTSQVIALDGAGEWTTDEYVTEAGQAGRYGWVETGYGPDGKAFGVGVCGEPAETFDVMAVWTTLGHEDTNGDGVAGAGDELWDDIHLPVVPKGASVELASTVYELTRDQVTWGEAAINTGVGNITVNPDVCTEAAVFTTLTAPEKATAGGVYSTNRFTLPDAGEYIVGGLTMVETATVTRGDETRTITGKCGEPDESIGPVYFGFDSAAAASDGADALAITGASRVAVMFGAGALLAMLGGSLARWSERRKTAVTATG